MTDAWVAAVINENLAEEATLSGGAYQSDLSNVQNRDIGDVARTLDATNASTIIKIDLGDSQQIEGIALANGNWSKDSLYRIRSSDHSDYSVLKYDTGWLNIPGCVVDSLAVGLEWDNPDFWDGVLRETILSEFPLNLSHLIEEDQRLNGWARYWKIEFDDAANVDGYLEYAYLMMGRVFRPLINFSEDNTAIPDPVSDMQETLGLSQSFFERGIRRQQTVGFPFLENDESLRKLTRMAVKSLDSRPIFFITDPSDDLHRQNESFLARIQSLTPKKRLLLPGRSSSGLSVQEWK